MAIKEGKSDRKHSAGAFKKDKKRLLTKIVVRRLPPDMTLDTFKEQVSPLPEHDYIWLAGASLPMGRHRFNRCYVNFCQLDDILSFRDRFDGYVFLDQQGFEYPAVVEFAPNQRVPRRSGRARAGGAGVGSVRVDARCGTIEDDPDYQAFLIQQLAAAETTTAADADATPTWELTLQTLEKRQQQLQEEAAAAAITPLVSFVCRRRAERRDGKRRDLDRRRDDQKSIRERRESRRELVGGSYDRERRDSGQQPSDPDVKSSTGASASSSHRTGHAAASDSSAPTSAAVEKAGHRSSASAAHQRGGSAARSEEQRQYATTGRPARGRRARDEELARRRKERDEQRQRRREEVGGEVAAGRTTKRTTEERRTATSDIAVADTGSAYAASSCRGSAEVMPSITSAVESSAEGSTPSPDPDDKTAAGSDSLRQRKIRNKDRPSIAIYRPGMGKYSASRCAPDQPPSCRNSTVSSPSPTSSPADRQRDGDVSESPAGRQRDGDCVEPDVTEQSDVRPRTTMVFRRSRH